MAVETTEPQERQGAETEKSTICPFLKWPGVILKQVPRAFSGSPDVYKAQKLGPFFAAFQGDEQGTGSEVQHLGYKLHPCGMLMQAAVLPDMPELWLFFLIDF